MRPAWKKLGRAVEIIVIVALVLVVALLWKRDPVQIVKPVLVTATEPVVFEREPEAGLTEQQAVRVRPPVQSRVDSDPAPPPVVSAPLPTPDQYRPDYSLNSAYEPPMAVAGCAAIESPIPDHVVDFDGQPSATLRIATMIPENSDAGRRYRAAARRIAARTEGRVSIKLYGGGTQGSEGRVLSKIRIGQLQGGTFGPSDFQDLYPDLSIYGLPLLFESEAEVRHVRERLDRHLIEGLREAGFVSFGFTGSFAHMFSNQQFMALSELNGSRVWVPEGGVIKQNWIPLHFSPVSLPVADVLTALQTGLLDSVFVPAETAVALQWHSKFRFVVNRPFWYSTSFMVIERRAFERLGRYAQHVVASEFQQVYCEMDRTSGVAAAEAMEQLLKIGISVLTLPDHDWELLHQGADEYRRQLAESDYIPGALYEEMQRLIDEFRNAN